MKTRVANLSCRTVLLLLSTTTLLAASAASLSAQGGGIPRTATGRPDLTGSYDAATLTPLQRPAQFGNKAFLTPEEAQAIAESERSLQENGAARVDPVSREAPPEGGSKVVGLEHTATGGNEFGAGNVGAYNLFWMDRGTDTITIDGKIPTSLIVDPPNGRMPSMKPAALRMMAQRAGGFRYQNDGTASWLEQDGPGPFDGPESLAINERCILGFTGSAPTLPSLYNNYKRIVQTEDHVMLLIEMVHDARIIPIQDKDDPIEHPPAGMHRWLGHSIGWWEGDSLVVDTRSFHPNGGMRGGSDAMHVVERFTKQPDGNLHYHFTVDDPETWTAPWAGETVWRSSEERVYEYACHEGNYSMTNVLKGARLLEKEYVPKKKR
jgi:hypothetical protein